MQVPIAPLAIIGGSGLYEMEGLIDKKELGVPTPFGNPSDNIILGTLDGTQVAFLPRHGRGHHLSPTDIPVRANIYALKSIGVKRIISVSAVGSLKEEIKPLDIMIPDQIIDLTIGRTRSFFKNGIVAHVGMADPYCPELRGLLSQVSKTIPGTTHLRGVNVVIEGPQFSTRAESELYRSWGGSVIGMTAQPEARLAREAEICYATLAMVTDYDCWHDSEEDVSVQIVISNLAKCVQTSKNIFQLLASLMPENRECTCSSALQNATITNPDLIAERANERLSVIIGDHLDQID